jgi:hypothetical protein
MLSKYESISGLIHWLDQSPYDPITSQWLDRPTGGQAFNTLAFLGNISYPNSKREVLKNGAAFYIYFKLGSLGIKVNF